ncbi:MAG: tol-pal system protein YbgF [Myxococcota bacterium]|nr:tol-pal system protein YbgF [Myxococcota bacterium]
MKEVRRVGRDFRSGPRPRGSFYALMALALLGLLIGPGCATKGDFRKLEERVLDQSRKNKTQPDPFERIAALSAEIESLRQEQQRLKGELEITQKKADDALAEARKARQAEVSKADKAGKTGTAAAAKLADSADDAATSKELIAYQEALQAWRSDEKQACIDGFREFLKDFPASPYADDAAYWMADCYFKQGDYRVAVLRFNDVVRVYPTGNKAADALYRQGESLLKLGPGFHDAARTVFKQVVKDYPDSDRAREAQQQLEAIGVG